MKLSIQRKAPTFLRLAHYVNRLALKGTETGTQVLSIPNTPKVNRQSDSLMRLRGPYTPASQQVLAGSNLSPLTCARYAKPLTRMQRPRMGREPLRYLRNGWTVSGENRFSLCPVFSTSRVSHDRYEWPPEQLPLGACKGEKSEGVPI